MGSQYDRTPLVDSTGNLGGRGRNSPIVPDIHYVRHEESASSPEENADVPRLCSDSCNDAHITLEPVEDQVLVSLPSLFPLEHSLVDSAVLPRSYSCLNQILPYLQNIMSPSLAYHLFEISLQEQTTSLLQSSSPFILTQVFRPSSILHPTSPRQLKPALLSTMLWCVAHTAEESNFRGIPGGRRQVCEALYTLSVKLIRPADPDEWSRAPVLNDQDREPGVGSAMRPWGPPGDVDDVLALLILAIVVSGGDFKSDCLKWLDKACRLAIVLKLDQEDGDSHSTGVCFQQTPDIATVERKEERRRLFWLLFSIDRHLALSFNSTVHIRDGTYYVFQPLPEFVWASLEDNLERACTNRQLGPPTTISGFGFYEYFLPLMTVLGDIIDIHHRRCHPRLGKIDDRASITAAENMIISCEQSLAALQGQTPRGYVSDQPVSQCELLLHVLHVLLHGNWDPISMLEESGDWISSESFLKCASHAVSASEALSRVLNLDPELTFMPYLLGIYLLHGSFILLLFADRMPQLGPNKSVKDACEIIIRAHEICVTTLNTEFQRRFRKVLRSALQRARAPGVSGLGYTAQRWDLLSLYRWAHGGKGLAV
ncbi:hypothetical protein TCE0_023r07207 [Talaromyces pinophilus]|uniref:Xylanolytic transcriptional activator regulatory domain-containing protein n=1 Tax=Talaromyces pinophilus TaxID=128442 RepID=A0A0B8N4U0_TALPI|nr:hypothetical protein TCE0_023r07207 [Talaromyces pinophilus]